MSKSTAPKKLYVIKFSNGNYWNGFKEEKQLRNAKIYTSMYYCTSAAEEHIRSVKIMKKEEITFKIIRVELKECEEVK